MQIYMVKQGDTLGGIAAAFGVSEERLRLYNGLLVGQTLVVGQALLIITPSALYTVQSGDTLSSIAAQNGISLRELLRYNPPLTQDSTLYAGQTLVLSFATEKRRELAVNGYVYPNVSLDLLRQNLPYITYLTVFSYGIRPDGSLLPLETDEPLIELARAYGVAPLMMLTTLGEDGRFNSALSTAVLTDDAVQEALIAEIAETMRRKGYEGLDVDFEFLDPAERGLYVQFIARLRERLNAEGHPVMVALAPKTSDEQAGLLYEGHDYGALGGAANNVLLMTYEWGYTYGPPMAVAPINKVREVVAYGVSRIANENIFMGVPNYGYDWPLPFVRGETRAPSVGNVQAVDLARRYSTSIHYDAVAATPFFYYTDEGGQAHVVWFEDLRSVLAKLDLTDEYQLRGISVWNLMRDFPQARMLTAVLYDIATYTQGSTQL